MPTSTASSASKTKTGRIAPFQATSRRWKSTVAKSISHSALEPHSQNDQLKPRAGEELRPSPCAPSHIHNLIYPIRCPTDGVHFTLRPFERAFRRSPTSVCREKTNSRMTSGSTEKTSPRFERRFRRQLVLDWALSAAHRDPLKAKASSRRQIPDLRGDLRCEDRRAYGVRR